MVRFVNLTPHEVVIYHAHTQNVVLRVPPSGRIARATTNTEIVGEVGGVPIRKVRYGVIIDLPNPIENTVYIVSTIVLLALQAKGIKRDDVVSPDTNPDSVVRDAQGRILGVKYFQII
jgi:hypothetical protein